MDLNEHINAMETYSRSAKSAIEHGDKVGLLTNILDVLQHACAALDWARPLPCESTEQEKV